MAISEDFKQELKRRTNIADIIGNYVKLKKSGRNLMGKCPFHGDDTPSFSVSPEMGLYHCFGCNESGDVIQFVRKIEHLDYMEAVRWLAQKAGLTVPETNNDNKMHHLRQRIFEANREAARFYVRQLYTPEGKEALAYLTKRQLLPKTITHFGLGYSPKSRFELVNYLRSKGFSGTELIQANLANQSQNGNPYDRFSDRIMFPIIDLQRRVLGFGGRIMSNNKPKYLNTSETPVFNKSENLYALQFAKNKANGQLILVEGYMDVIALHQAGFENAVATLGTALTQEQALIIKRYCEEVVICYDADEAGQRATARAIGILRPLGINIKILTVPNGKDPDEFMKSHGEQGPARFRMLLNNSGNDIDYRLTKLRSGYHLDITQQRVEFLTKACELLSQLDNSIERDIYISKLAEELGVEKAAIKEQTQQSIRTRQYRTEKDRQRSIQRSLTVPPEGFSGTEPFNLRVASAEDALISLLMAHPDVAVSVFSTLSPTLFPTAFHRMVYELLRDRAAQGYNFTFTDISDKLSADERNRLGKLLMSHFYEENPTAAAKDYIDILQEESEKLSPQQIAEADDNTLLEEMRKIRSKKQ